MKTMKKWMACAVLVTGITAIGPAHAALNAFAELTANGTPLDGLVTMNTIGGVDVSSNHIEIFSMEQASMVDVQKKAQQVAVGPFVLSKRVDNTSPLLLKALTNGDNIEGTIKLFDNDPNTGETRLFFTIQILHARVTSVRQRLPDTFVPEEAVKPVMEEIEIVAGSVVWTDEISGEEHQYSFGQAP